MGRLLFRVPSQSAHPTGEIHRVRISDDSAIGLLESGITKKLVVGDAHGIGLSGLSRSPRCKDGDDTLDRPILPSHVEVLVQGTDNAFPTAHISAVLHFEGTPHVTADAAVAVAPCPLYTELQFGRCVHISPGRVDFLGNLGHPFFSGGFIHAEARISGHVREEGLGLSQKGSMTRGQGGHFNKY